MAGRAREAAFATGTDGYGKSDEEYVCEMSEHARGPNMQRCEFVETCPFVNQDLRSQPTVAWLYVKANCCAGKDRCARRIVGRALGAGAVPQSLFPTAFSEARDLLRNMR